MASEKLKSSYREFEADSSIQTHVEELYVRSLRHLQTVEQRAKVARILTDYADFFARHPDDIGRNNLLKNEIETGDAKQVRQKCRRLAKSQIKAIQEYVNATRRQVQ